jgi:hypothetical protein
MKVQTNFDVMIRGEHKFQYFSLPIPKKSSKKVPEVPIKLFAYRRTNSMHKKEDKLDN